MTEPILENINDRFFEGAYREVWRRTIPAGLTEAECDFIQQSAALQPGGTVLDLLCGYGRHSLELARRGQRVTAVDNSAPYIEEIKTAATAGNLPVEAVCAPALDYAAAPAAFDAVLCMGNSFAFFDPADTVRFCRSIAGALRPGGRFVFNSWTIAEVALRHYNERVWSQLEGYKYLVASRWLHSPSRIESEHTMIDAENGVQTLRGVDYIYSLNELETFFGAAGMKLEGVWSTPRRRPFRPGDAVAYVVASRNI
ncbi:MAG: methyltransferase domain-containing protein [Chitinophagaceae bacterium]|nr:MAG: methyltransferase domain-containing protein [Chitinophagaceae bacterium]